MNKRWYIHIVEYYLAINMHQYRCKLYYRCLEDIMLSGKTKHKQHIMLDSIYMKLLVQVNPERQKVGWQLPRARVWAQMDTDCQWT